MKDVRSKGCTNFIIVFTILGFATALIALLLFKGFGSTVEHGQVSITVDPKGELLAFTSAKGGLFTFRLTDQRVKQLRMEGLGAYEPAFSPSGDEVVFASSFQGGEGRSLFSCSRDGGAVKRLTNNNAVSDSSPCYSPDGSKIAFFRAARYRPYSMGGMVFDDYDLCLLDLKTNAVTQLTHQKYYQGGSPAFSSDGQSILFSACQGDGDLAVQGFKVTVKTTEITKIDPPGPPDQSGGAWMSDLSGSKTAGMITFLSDRERSFDYDIYVAGPEGERPRGLMVTRKSSYNQDPKFASDGQSIYYLAGTSRNLGSRAIYCLYQVDLHGRMEQVADSGLFTDPSAWKPPTMSVYVP